MKETRQPGSLRPCAPGGILPNPIGRTEAERLNNYTELPVMAAATITHPSLLLLRGAAEQILLCFGFDLHLRLDGIATQPCLQLRTLEIEHLALRLVVRNQIARRQFVEVAFREVQKTAGLLEAQHVFGLEHLLFEFCNSHLNTFLHNSMDFK